MLSVFNKFSKGLSKTKGGLVGGISHAVRGRKIDEEMLEELEEQLILSDVGVETAEIIIEDLRDKARQKKAITEDDVIQVLKDELVKVLNEAVADAPPVSETPHVISIVGVNGTGKTTTLGKLAHRFAQQDQQVLMAAADTFRAAAVEQLGIWADRSNVEVIRNETGADPASVAFDALSAAIARKTDVLMIDTAGRLHTKANLMQELSKIHRVLGRQMPNAPHEILLVMDATTGQNGLSQAKQFSQAVHVTGIVLTKLDGTAKGGIVFSVAKELGIPVRYIGVGEQIDDLAEFDPKLFVEALFE